MRRAVFVSLLAGCAGPPPPAESPAPAIVTPAAPAVPAAPATGSPAGADLPAPVAAGAPARPGRACADGEPLASGCECTDRRCMDLCCVGSACSHGGGPDHGWAKCVSPRR